MAEKKSKTDVTARDKSGRVPLRRPGGQSGGQSAVSSAVCLLEKSGGRAAAVACPLKLRVVSVN
jgi:hypothetical protein